MTETGLIIAEVAFLVLLYLFIWAIIRASSRQLGTDPPALPAPADDAPLVVPLAAQPEPAPSAPAFEPIEPIEPIDLPPAEDGGGGPILAGIDPEPEPVPPAPPATDIGEAAVIGGVLADAHGDDEAPPSEDDVFEAEQSAELGDDALEEVAPEGAQARRAERDPLIDLASDIHPRLVVEESPSLTSGQEFDLSGGVTIGRSASSDLAITDQFVSHMHARILRRGQYYFVEDLGSTNGTFINDRRVEGDAQLRVRDLLRMGDTVLRYEE